ncbi:MAG: NDP-sugar synthase [Candidatus Peregrinibacteria bacterium]|nr:NDP-sugar synthase [Candidatus Peregrinibacteria bacterium]MCB9808132.1 NDP-sugar synthase [Candidatus Peribacteria bacterium]
MQAFILAGGFATRLWPLTEKRAKPLLPLAGIPLIEHLVRDIPEDIPITVSTNAIFKDDFEQWAKSYGRNNIRILIEETKSDDQKLGALGATAQWIERQNISEDVLLLTGDNYCGFSFDTFLKAASPDTTLIAVHDIKSLERAKQFGTVLADDTTVTGFEEKPREPKTTLVNTGCSLLPASTLPILTHHAKLHPDNVGGVFEELLRQGKPIACFAFSEPWFDIGSFDAYIEATKELVGNRIIEEEGASIEQSEVTGSLVIGARSSIKDSTLEHVVLFEDCIVEDCVLRNCVLDKGCILKGIDLDCKMLREGTKLLQNK